MKTLIFLLSQWDNSHQLKRTSEERNRNPHLKVVNNYELLHLHTYTGVTYFHVIVVTQKQSEEFLKL